MHILKSLFLSLLVLLFAFTSFATKANVVYVQGEKGGGSGKTEFVVNYPLNFIREVISDDKLFMQLIPGIQNWKVVQQTANSQIAQCKMAMTKLVPPANYLVQVNQVSKDEVKFKRLKGDLKYLEGYWKLKPGSNPNTTLVTYYYKVDTGMNLVPKVIIEKELTRHLQETEAKTHRQLKQIYSKNQFSKAKASEQSV